MHHTCYFNIYVYMSQAPQDKDKKITDLRSLLTQAKAKIEEYKAQLQLKEKQAQQLKKQYEKKIKMFEGDSENIIKQYEQRLLRYQKTLQESNHLIQKHQKGMQYASKNYQELLKKITNLYQISNKMFSSSSKEKQGTDAVEELCQIQKCKQYLQSLDKFADISDLEVLTKLLVLLAKNSQQHLNKRREQRIQFLKKQTHYQKTIQQQKSRSKLFQSQIESYKKELSEVRDKHQKQIDSITFNNKKKQQEKTSQQFIKQLFIKVILGPKDATVMAFGILAKIFKLNEDQIKNCQKKLK